ncbi:MAG: PEP-CTERM sorting domain-containing protein [Methylophilaceae bacterium]|nr:PEP-CTERM sorting domain-containing protein [Methyloradius sp.]
MKFQAAGLAILVFLANIVTAEAAVTYSSTAPTTGTQINLGTTAIPAYLLNQTFGIATFTGGAIGLAAGSDYSGTAAAPAGTTGTFWTIGTSGYNTGSYTPGTVAGLGSITFAQALTSLSFQWGSPDGYNTASFYSNGALLGSISGSEVPSGYGNGDRSISAFVTFSAAASNPITNVVFTSSSNAFETANFSYVAAAVPEPETYLMMLMGIGLIGFMAKRRNKTLA